MKIKFNKFERVAGLFVLTAIVGSIVTGVGVAVKRGWFDTKVNYKTQFPTASGIHPGTLVQINGLKAGSVDEVELRSDNTVMVDFHVLGKFHERIKTDSRIFLVRPFIIGEKIIDLQLGSETASVLPPDSLIEAGDSFDFMDVFSGRELGTYLKTLGGLVNNLKIIAEAFADPERTKNVIKVFDRIDPLTANVNDAALGFVKVASQVNDRNNLGKVMSEMVKATREMNQMLPGLVVATGEMNKFLPIMSERAPQMAEDMTVLVKNMSEISEQFKIVMPVLAEIGPELPQVSRRAIEALNETVIVLKAMEKSFMFRGNVEDVRKEEQAQKDAKSQRLPASQKENETP